MAPGLDGGLGIVKARDRRKAERYGLDVRTGFEHLVEVVEGFDAVTVPWRDTVAASSQSADAFSAGTCWSTAILPMPTRASFMAISANPFRPERRGSP